MGTHLDHNAPSSLGQRRQAASNLPQFELPPPSNIQFTAQPFGHKFPPLQMGSHAQPPASVSVGNLLTPPSNSTSDSGSSSAHLPTGTNQNAHAIPVLPYTPTFWSNTPNGFGSGMTPQPWQNQSLYGSRSMFSPGLRNHSNSPATGEQSSLPPPPYEMNHSNSYPSSMGMPSPAVNAHASAAQHHHNQMMANMMPVRPSSQASPISPDGISKPSSAPSLYAPMSASNTPQPSQYNFQSSTPVSQSRIPVNTSTAQISPPLRQGPISQQSQNQFHKPPYPSYTLPAMPGAVMTNVHSPGAHMSMVGSLQAGMLPMNYNSGYAANPQAMYAQPRGNSPQQATNNDRPFKCDQCPQSFNRNHDLKRHKRIHLAVKPFPCKHCDKSFSRKDALKVSQSHCFEVRNTNILPRDTFLSKVVAVTQALTTVMVQSQRLVVTTLSQKHQQSVLQLKTPCRLYF